MSITALFKSILFATLAALALYSGYYFGKARMDDRLLLAAGDPAPDFALPDLEGVMHDSQRYRGRLLLVNFWAPWCESCREEVPLLIQARRTHAAADLQILGIALDQRQRTRQFRDEYGINYPVLVSAEGQSLLAAYDRSGAIPLSVLIGTDGRILHLKLGPYRGDELQAALAAAMEIGG